MSYPKLMKSNATEAIYLVSAPRRAKCLDAGANRYMRVGELTTTLNMYVMEDFEIPTEEVSTDE